MSAGDIWSFRDNWPYWAGFCGAATWVVSQGLDNRNAYGVLHSAAEASTRIEYLGSCLEQPHGYGHGHAHRHDYDDGMDAGHHHQQLYTVKYKRGQQHRHYWTMCIQIMNIDITGSISGTHTKRGALTAGCWGCARCRGFWIKQLLRGADGPQIVMMAHYHDFRTVRTPKFPYLVLSTGLLSPNNALKPALVVGVLTATSNICSPLYLHPRQCKYER